MSFYELTNVGIYLDWFNTNLFQLIKKEVIENCKDYENHVDFESTPPEYAISEKLTNLVNTEILKLIHAYESKYQYFDRLFNYTTNVDSNDLQISLERMWVNIQRPGDFLPLHKHSGIYSFVIWVQVPFLMSEEKTDTQNKKLIKSRSANFEFVFTDILGKINNYIIPVDSKMEGRICIFPSELYHQVYPFYSSDKVRLSLAGNYRLNILK